MIFSKSQKNISSILNREFDVVFINVRDNFDMSSRFSVNSPLECFFVKYQNDKLVSIRYKNRPDSIGIEGFMENNVFFNKNKNMVVNALSKII